MIADLFFYSTGFVAEMIGHIIPSWTIWPQSVFDAIEYFVTILMKINFIFPIDTLFICMVIFLKFISYYLLFRIGLRFFAGIPIFGKIQL